MMTGMFDPTTLASLAIGLMTGIGGLVVIVGVEGARSRRFKRRVDRIKDRSARTPAAAVVAGVPSLARTTSSMDRLVQRYVPRLDVLKDRLARTGRDIGVGHYAIATLIAIAVLLAAVMVFGHLKFIPSLGIAIGLGTYVPFFLVGRMGRRRVAAFIKLFPEAIDLMVRALRSGLPISEAIVNAGHEISDPVGTELRTIESGMRLGRQLDDLLWDIGKRIDAPEFRFFIIALNVQRETGGNLAETLQNLSDVLRKRRTMRAKARAMASEARASTAILGSLPIVVSGLLLLTTPSYIMILFTDVRGLMMLGVAGGMLGIGIMIMTKMARFQI